MLDVILWIGIYVALFNLPEIVMYSIKIPAKVRKIIVKETIVLKNN